MESPERSLLPARETTPDAQQETEPAHEKIIEELKAEIERLKREAGTDQLTGAYNRRGFEEKFNNQRVSEKNAIAILLVDIDHFRDFNNLYGHAQGDAVLKTVSEQLHAGRRSHDIVARWGGEEFLVAFSGADAQDIVNAFYEKKDPGEPDKERRAKINIPITLEDGKEPVMITLSGGVTTLRPDEDIEAAIKRADKTLYRAKDGGRDRIESGDSITEEMASDGVPSGKAAEE